MQNIDPGMVGPEMYIADNFIYRAFDTGFRVITKICLHGLLIGAIGAFLSLLMGFSNDDLLGVSFILSKRDLESFTHWS